MQPQSASSARMCPTHPARFSSSRNLAPKVTRAGRERPLSLRTSERAAPIGRELCDLRRCRQTRAGTANIGEDSPPRTIVNFVNFVGFQLERPSRGEALLSKGERLSKRWREPAHGLRSDPDRRRGIHSRDAPPCRTVTANIGEHSVLDRVEGRAVTGVNPVTSVLSASPQAGRLSRSLLAVRDCSCSRRTTLGRLKR